MRLFYKSKKLLYIVIAVVLCACALTACTDDDYGSFEEGNITGGYDNHEAFVGTCFWDGGDKVIEIPDEYNNVPIYVLGGYVDGTHNPFAIVLRDRDYVLYRNITELPDDEYETITFTVKIGKNLGGVKNVLGKTFYGIKTTDENGDEIIDIVYKVAYYFEVDSKNEMFYSKDGKLYHKLNDALEERFFYE